MVIGFRTDYYIKFTGSDCCILVIVSSLSNLHLLFSIFPAIFLTPISFHSGREKLLILLGKSHRSDNLRTTKLSRIHKRSDSRIKKTFFQILSQGYQSYIFHLACQRNSCADQITIRHIFHGKSVARSLWNLALPKERSVFQGYVAINSRRKPESKKCSHTINTLRLASTLWEICCIRDSLCA